MTKSEKKLYQSLSMINNTKEFVTVYNKDYPSLLNAGLIEEIGVSSSKEYNFKRYYMIILSKLGKKVLKKLEKDKANEK